MLISYIIFPGPLCIPLAELPVAVVNLASVELKRDRETKRKISTSTVQPLAQAPLRKDDCDLCNERGFCNV
jgi:hypothetical protein